MKFSIKDFFSKCDPLREKCPYSEIFWLVFSRIWTEDGEIQSIFPCLVRMWENKYQKNSEYRHFSCSDKIHSFLRIWSHLQKKP